MSSEMEPLLLAWSYFRRRKFQLCADLCTQMLEKSPYDQKISWAWWHVPVIPATWEAEAGESLEPRKRRLQRAEITPLYSSLGNKSKTPSQKAAWILKARALTEMVYIDEIDIDQEGIAEMMLDENAIAQVPRPGTSLKLPGTNQTGGPSQAANHTSWKTHYRFPQAQHTEWKARHYGTGYQNTQNRLHSPPYHQLLRKICQAGNGFHAYKS
ncbi:TTC8 isoform 3 [Pan troglodytes]|uniref:TTC8 isoform 3 n=1 Tax=Pan troglodytes TaxID=9598 RepID=A0A2J8PKS6_PANTR|nr:TTC8 isoform 3 [Pan troglodytes]